jgi:hypothetical protein
VGVGREQQGELLQSWERDGFFIARGFADAATCDPMLERALELAREGVGHVSGGALVVPEAKRDPAAKRPEQGVSKIFKLHRDPVFRDFLVGDELRALVSALLGDDLDCFLSQFIFKNPGAMGQPWHQDAFYFPFDRGPQVGIWLAVTEATLENGCLHVLPGSQRDPVHEHVVPGRSDSNYGYMEIVERDTSGSVPVLMQPGDLLVFHSHLMHRSTDNMAKGLRAAMVYHYAESGTRDRGASSPVNDWMPVQRGGRLVPELAA